MDNKILEFLENENARLSLGDRWLVVDKEAGGIIVHEHKYGKHKTSTLYAGNNLGTALDTLKGLIS
jgi:hypothetical protein